MSTWGDAWGRMGKGKKVRWKGREGVNEVTHSLTDKETGALHSPDFAFGRPRGGPGRQISASWGAIAKAAADAETAQRHWGPLYGPPARHGTPIRPPPRRNCVIFRAGTESGDESAPEAVGVAFRPERGPLSSDVDDP